MSTVPHPYREERPWGEFITFAKNERCTVKLLKIKPGERFSLQHHAHRTEFWHILKGNGTIEIGNISEEILIGKEYIVGPKTLHRITGGTEEVVVLEVSYGEFDEEDIVRVEDKYSRA